MKMMILGLLLFLSVISIVEAKIIRENDDFFIKSKKHVAPIFMINKLIKENAISKIKIYGNGSIHLLSFAKDGESEMLYSVDEEGYIYTIRPFSSYTVSKVGDDGSFQFREQPGTKYKVSAKGFFFH